MKPEWFKLENNIYWIGGSSCSGKSSCAKLLAEQNNYVLYKTDDYAFGKYMFGLDNIQEYPAIEKYKNQICEGVNSFIERDTNISYRSFVEYCHEVFPFLLSDVIELSKGNSVIVEGAHILPELLANNGINERAIFLISTEDQQRAIWRKEMNKEILGGNEHEINDYQQTANKKAFEDARIGLHQKIADHIRTEAIKYGKEYMLVTQDTSVTKVRDAVVSYFRLR